MAFWLWSMSGFQRLPNQDEVAQYDPRYVDDLRLMYQIYAHQKNDSVVQTLFEQYESARKSNFEKGYNKEEFEYMKKISEQRR